MAFAISKYGVETFCKGNKKFETICPRCGKELGEYPALSRFADVHICSECGTEEAFENFFYKKRTDFTDWRLGR